MHGRLASRSHVLPEVTLYEDPTLCCCKPTSRSCCRAVKPCVPSITVALPACTAITAVAVAAIWAALAVAIVRRDQEFERVSNHAVAAHGSRSWEFATVADAYNGCAVVIGPQHDPSDPTKHCDVYCRSSATFEGAVSWLIAATLVATTLCITRCLAFRRRFAMSWFRVYVEDVVGTTSDGRYAKLLRRQDDMEQVLRAIASAGGVMDGMLRLQLQKKLWRHVLSAMESSQPLREWGRSSPHVTFSSAHGEAQLFRGPLVDDDRFAFRDDAEFAWPAAVLYFYGRKLGKGPRNGKGARSTTAWTLHYARVTSTRAHSLSQLFSGEPDFMTPAFQLDASAALWKAEPQSAAVTIVPNADAWDPSNEKAAARGLLPPDLRATDWHNLRHLVSRAGSAPTLLFFEVNSQELESTGPARLWYHRHTGAAKVPRGAAIRVRLSAIRRLYGDASASLGAFFVKTDNVQTVEEWQQTVVNEVMSLIQQQVRDAANTLCDPYWKAHDRRVNAYAAVAMCSVALCTTPAAASGAARRRMRNLSEFPGDQPNTNGLLRTLATAVAECAALGSGHSGNGSERSLVGYFRFADLKHSMPIAHGLVDRLLQSKLWGLLDVATVAFGQAAVGGASSADAPGPSPIGGLPLGLTAADTHGEQRGHGQALVQWLPRQLTVAALHALLAQNAQASRTLRQLHVVKIVMGSDTAATAPPPAQLPTPVVHHLPVGRARGVRRGAAARHNAEAKQARPASASI